jgi:starch-binding outer membrane protein SusE/F
MNRACFTQTTDLHEQIQHVSCIRPLKNNFVRMKTRILTFIIGYLLLITACKKDGDLFKIFGMNSAELMSSETSVVLTKETSANSVLALTWDNSELKLNTSDKSVGIPGSVPNQVIEVSSNSDFANVSEITPQSNSYSFIGVVLNTLGKNLGLKSGVSTPLYFRVTSALGVNTQPYYSNVVTVNITCYSIDMSLGFMLDSHLVDTGFKLYAANSDGEYLGFTGVTAWYNWFLLEGDGTTWGNLPLDGNAFALSKDATAWNFWYPGIGGCYYTTVSTANKQWTATNIPSLSVTGDVTTTMTFDRTTVKWYVSLTTTADNQKIKVNCTTAKQYTKVTSTDDASAISKTIGFVPHSDSTLTFDWNSAAAGDITFKKAGDYTLTFYLANPKSWTYQIKSGKTVVVEPISHYLYLPGIDDGTSGSWTFNNYLKLLSEDDSTFVGAVNVNSLWGYNMSLISGEWTNVYKMGSTEGTLKFKGASNITAPSAGLYLIQADLKHLTYSHTAISSLSYAGFNDDWTMKTLTATSVAGVYSSSVTINGPSQWGAKLYLNSDWNSFFGGDKGALAYKGTGITDDATIASGTYDLVTDLRNDASYVFLGNEVYVGGLNDVWDFTSVVLTKSSTGVYAGTATITSKSSWGIKIYLQKDNWDRFFGGSFGSMKYVGANITDDQSLAAGTYNVTADFLNHTCKFEAKKK